ncbi:MAG: DUF2283 domain-containing protein [Patescibacteria group bacterium]
MHITYDRKADAMYLYFQPCKKIARTVELADLLVADFDKQGKVIGVEVLCASRQIGKNVKAKQPSKPGLFSMAVPIPIAA